MNSCPHSKDVIAYCMGLLTGEKKRKFEEHVKTCVECQQEMKVQQAVNTTMVKQQDPGDIESFVISKVRLIRNMKPKFSWRYVFQVGIYVAAAITLLWVFVPKLANLLFVGERGISRVLEHFPSMPPGFFTAAGIGFGLLFILTGGWLTYKTLRE